MLQKNKGFTLIELVVTMVIMGILGVVIFNGVSAFFRSIALVSNNILLMSDINNVATNFELDVKGIDIDTTGGNYQPEVTAFSATSFSFQNYGGRNVTYTIEGTALQKNGRNILFSELDPDQSQFAFSGYVGGVEVDAIANGLAASEVRKVTFTYMVKNDNISRSITQTFALNFR